MDSFDNTANIAAETLWYIESMPFPIGVFLPDGFMAAMNKRAEQLWNLDRQKVIGRYNILQDPAGLQARAEEISTRLLAGDIILLYPRRFVETSAHYDTSPSHDYEVWVQMRLFPIFNDHQELIYFASIYDDITEQVRLDQRIEQARSEIERQRATLDELSTPIIQVWDGILTVPLVGTMDARRSMRVTEQLLEAIVEYQADIVLLDITGVPLIDTEVANSLLQAIRAVSLLGSRVVLVGIHAELAQTLTNIGIDLSAIVTLSNLQAGLEWAFSRQGVRVIAS